MRGKLGNALVHEPPSGSAALRWGKSPCLPGMEKKYIGRKERT